MLIILDPSIDENSFDYQYTLQALRELPNVTLSLHTIQGTSLTITEAYLIGDTNAISLENIEALPGVKHVIRISNEYKILGRKSEDPGFSFEYNGVTFSQENLNVFAGLCAVDSHENVECMMKALQTHGQVCTRMGAYKPRTSPYSFQGLEKSCLPFVFELAGKYGIKVIAMEVTHERHIDEIFQALALAGEPTGVMLQIGTRNAQNFELLRAVGSQSTFPILFKRGYGISLRESLHAAEYLAQGNNHNIIFCLRGVKTLFGAPHRNLVDFAHVPVIKRLTRMPVGIDPSHSSGTLARGADNISDIFHVTAQGVVAGANLILTDFHPYPPSAMVDSRQAIPISQLGWYLEDIAIARDTYERRKALAARENP